VLITADVCDYSASVLAHYISLYVNSKILLYVGMIVSGVYLAIGLHFTITFSGTIINDNDNDILVITCAISLL